MNLINTNTNDLLIFARHVSEVGHSFKMNEDKHRYVLIQKWLWSKQASLNEITSAVLSAFASPIPL